ncbi:MULTISPECIES: MCE family protein [unclassified Mycolicibacterium]|uniref:MCE family protein n=2 Tax=Mycolicibacterium TaxID=1866885 RepID=UPI0012DF98FB|nr:MULTISPECIES: MCE family protein [unclassified Mycolicibacterium]MUL83413.1 MCE family protein [Mycolicibacterium sp. CBMA 329]MUL90404.1 MCE family protein [Mycolicibacterium sp. CBMA 331]MUM00377.1 MCE family protein [Mycolicibacterium sp. CBMA 334]MUM41348.1 MCE family protein [Mycolicibacterium sp. CBMA 247]MUM45812.1 MCE family protein [Mycolicibacterium sp. CBMA 294]
MNRSRLGKWLAVALVALLVVGAAVLLRQTFFGQKTISALFTSATGVYPGDDVRVSGVKVGTIESIQPEGTQTRVTLKLDRDVPIPADAKAVIVAQNLVAARYVQLAPAYRSSGPTLADDAVIGLDHTAVPVEWDQVKEQLMRLSTDLGPQSGVDGTAVSRFINRTADAMAGNGDKLHQTISQLSGVARVLAEGSGNIVDIIKNLQTFLTALRDSNQQVVSFQNRLATLTSVVDGSRSDLDAALTNLSVAVVEVQRFVAGSRDQTSEQVQRLGNVIQNLVDNRMEIENLLHIAPNAFMNGYNIYNPDTGSAVGQFVMNNFSSPVDFICGAIGAIENTTAPETAKLCSQYLGPALRLLNFNYLPFPITPYLMPSAKPENIIYSEPNLAPGTGGPVPGAPNLPPTISAYNPGPTSPLPFTGRDPGVAPPGAQQMLPGGSYVPPNMPNTVSDMLNPVGPQPGPLPAEAAAPAAPLPAEGTPPA